MKKRMTTAALTLLVAAASWGADAKYGSALFSVDGEANNIHNAGLYHLQLYDRLWAGDTGGGYGGGNYPGRNGTFTLYTGDFWVGTNAWGTARVSGGQRGKEWYDPDGLIWSDGSSWEGRPVYIEKWGDLDSFLIVDDRNAEEGGPIGLSVEQHGLQWSDAPNDDYILFHYRVVNASGRDLNDLRVCLYYDFDVGGEVSYEDDKVGVDASRKMPYMYDDIVSYPYVGLYVVDGKASAGGMASEWENNADQWRMMTSGQWYEATTPSDYQAFVSSGPHAVRAGEKLRFGFAVVAGADLAELRAHADAAYEKYWEVFTGLVDFTARAKPRGVEVRWVPDRPYAGYNLYRASAAAAGFARLNATPIAGRAPFAYVDGEVEPGRAYRYKLEALSLGGASEWFGPVEVTAAGMPAAFSVQGPYPNPVHGRAAFSVCAEAPGPFEISLYDLSGRCLRSERSWCRSGESEVTLDVNSLPAGVYGYRVAGAGSEAFGKMVVAP